MKPTRKSIDLLLEVTALSFGLRNAWNTIWNEHCLNLKNSHGYPRTTSHFVAFANARFTFLSFCLYFSLFENCVLLIIHFDLPFTDGNRAARGQQQPRTPRENNLQQRPPRDTDGETGDRRPPRRFREDRGPLTSQNNPNFSAAGAPGESKSVSMFLIISE